MRDDEEPLLRILKITAAISEFIVRILGAAIVLSVVYLIVQSLVERG
ncbi:MAG: hypothetical protein GTO63_15245 [Anaerolineae bacterium]|nr:hypothetical protein [Anaerolineae bacterium]NIN96186.1 hypothetical protein [Anaerolineae bacterium]